MNLNSVKMFFNLIVNKNKNFLSINNLYLFYFELKKKSTIAQIKYFCVFSGKYPKHDSSMIHFILLKN